MVGPRVSSFGVSKEQGTLKSEVYTVYIQYNTSNLKARLFPLSPLWTLSMAPPVASQTPRLQS